jgi:hypothetical protein
MPNRRACRPDGTVFLTVDLLQRHCNNLLVEHIDLPLQVPGVWRNALRLLRPTGLVVFLWLF